MPITNICLSDLHAGAVTSLLTPLDPTELKWKPNLGPTEVTTTFFTAFNKFCDAFARIEGNPPDDKTDLIILGDALDLSFSPPARSFEILKEYLHALYSTIGDHLSENMIFIPGNHDHSIWTAERYQRMVDANVKDAKEFEITKLFTPLEDAPSSGLLQSLFKNNKIGDLNPELPDGEPASGNIHEVKVRCYNPNFGIINEDQSKSIIFHHGHYVESMYRMMSKLQQVLSNTPQINLNALPLEAQNANWIDFGWSTIGQSEALGLEITTVYQYLLSGSRSDHLQKRMALHLSEQLIDLANLPRTKDISHGAQTLAFGIIDSLIGKFSQLERYGYTEHLSAESVQGLIEYLEKTVLPQMMDEIKKTTRNTTFVFGHTHKPFEDRLVVNGYDMPVDVYNTGGWILDTSLFCTVEGAAVILVDEHLNVASLRLFSPPVNGQIECPRIKFAGHMTESAKKFIENLEAALDETDEEWRAFTQATIADFELRQQKILAMAKDEEIYSNRHGGVMAETSGAV